MMKKYKTTIIITALVTLLPMVMGLLLWNRLPQQVPIHWNMESEVDDWGSKEFAVFGLPLFLTAIHLFTSLMMCVDPKNKEKKQNVPDKLFRMLLWLIPLLSIVVNSMVYMAALQMPVRISYVVPLLLGLLFIILGNYLPKCAQNYTVGIRLPWTLDNEENWRKTHRLAGKCYVAAGMLMPCGAFLPCFWILFLTALVPVILVPVIYSYCLYKKQNPQE